MCVSTCSLLSIITLICLTSCADGISGETIQAVPNYERNYRFPFSNSTRTYARSRIDCAKSCTSDDSCLSMNVKKEEGRYVCEVGGEAAFLTNYSSLEKDKGSRYYEKKATCMNGGEWNYTSAECFNCQFLTYGKFCHQYVEDCGESFLRFPEKRDEKYTIFIKPQDAEYPFLIICKMVFQGIMSVAKRMISANPSEEFNRTWNEYKNGFGSFAQEYFLGLEKLHLITQNRTHRLKVVVTFIDGTQGAYNYRDFRIDSEANSYEIHYSGTIPGQGQASDGFNYGHIAGRIIDGTPFCTIDNDCNGCAKSSSSGWWFNTNCANVNLHGPKNTTQSFEWPEIGTLQKLHAVEFQLFVY